MLNKLVFKNRSLFDSMAQAWLDSGAQAFRVLTDTQKQIASWQADQAEQLGQQETMSAPIKMGGQHLGSLDVVGLNGQSNETRLKEEVQLLHKWLTVEQEVTSLTNELIQYQDQLLMLYELRQTSRRYLEHAPIIANYLHTGRKLLRVERLILIRGVADDHQAEWDLADLEVTTEPAEIELSPSRETLLLDVHRHRKETHIQQPFGPPDDETWQQIFVLPVQGQLQEPVTLIAINPYQGRFNTPTKKMGMALADLLGSELERLALHQQILTQARQETESAMARDVQMRLLPRQSPSIQGVDVWGMANPARQVGGDYYDLIEMGPNELFFTLADVSGKGMAAALSMANLRSALRTAVRLLPQFDIQTVLHQTFDSLYDDFTDVEMFATIFCGYYNHLKQTIYYSNGGHSPVIYCPAGQPARMLKANGPALGIMRDAPIGCDEISFGPGDLILAATDGFNEAENLEGEMFGIDRLLTLAEQLNHYPAAMIAKILSDEILHFRGNQPQQDDQTIVVLKGVT
ncbi:MAG: PP2C family protein-serine/threonine phosphatase [Ardenticatenaceae bacterium]|nr:PP2C family protein-serine/threonine phosphatase [Ardenticatenaceae bacterium]